MTNDEQGRPGIGVWLAVAASAIAGTVKLVTRPDLEPGDLVFPFIVTAVLVGALLSVRVFRPQALSNPERNAGLLIGFGIGMIFAILVFAAAGD